MICFRINRLPDKDVKDIKKMKIAQSKLNYDLKGVEEYQSLEILNASFTSLAVVNEEIKSLTALVILDISNNMIISLPWDLTFSNALITLYGVSLKYFKFGKIFKVFIRTPFFVHVS